MYIVSFFDNVMSLRLFERVCWLPYCEKCKLCLEIITETPYSTK